MFTLGQAGGFMDCSIVHAFVNVCVCACVCVRMRSCKLIQPSRAHPISLAHPADDRCSGMPPTTPEPADLADGHSGRVASSGGSGSMAAGLGGGPPGRTTAYITDGCIGRVAPAAPAADMADFGSIIDNKGDLIVETGPDWRRDGKERKFRLREGADISTTELLVKALERMRDRLVVKGLADPANFEHANLLERKIREVKLQEKISALEGVAALQKNLIEDLVAENTILKRNLGHHTHAATGTDSPETDEEGFRPPTKIRRRHEDKMMFPTARPAGAAGASSALSAGMAGSAMSAGLAGPPGASASFSASLAGPPGTTSAGMAGSVMSASLAGSPGASASSSASLAGPPSTLEPSFGKGWPWSLL